MIKAGDLKVRAPFPGESLDGYVADVVGDNDLRTVRSVSSSAGVTYGHRPQLTTIEPSGLQALADLLEIDVDALAARSFPPVGADGSRRAFFGTTVHRSDLRIRTRWFAPSALATSPHHRAMWQLKLPFDVVTGELLVSTCPRLGCGKVQRWRHSAGTAWCDTCVQDLSQQEVPRIQGDVLLHYDLAAGLTHTDPVKRAESLSLLPDQIRGLGADMAYELLLRLVPVLAPDCSSRTGGRPWSNDPFAIAGGMASAWRALRDWPRSMIDKMTADIAVAANRHNDGNGGRTAAFLRARNGEFVPPPIAKVVRALHSMIDENGPEGERIRRETIGCREAANVTGLSTTLIVPLRRRGLLRTKVVARGQLVVPVLDRDEVMTLEGHMRSRWSLNKATPALGLPYYALEQFVALGRLRRLEHPYFAARYADPQVTKEAVQRFAASVLDSASAGLVGSVPIHAAMRMVGGRLKPWDAIVEAMLSGALPFEVRDGHGPLFDRVWVRRDDLRGPAALPITRPGVITALTARMMPAFPFSEHMTKRDAGEVLNLAEQQYTHHLRHYRTTQDRVVPIADVIGMATIHVTSTEIAERLGISHQAVRGKARSLGIHRISEAGFCRALAERIVVSTLCADNARNVAHASENIN